MNVAETDVLLVGFIARPIEGSLSLALASTRTQRRVLAECVRAWLSYVGVEPVEFLWILFGLRAC